MKINQLRSWLYTAAKILGDVQAVTSDKPGAVQRRVARRIAGKAAGRALGKFDRWLRKA